MPALRVCGQRLPYIAGDDLRGIAKIVGVVRLVQITVLVPALWCLSQTRRRTLVTVAVASVVAMSEKCQSDRHYKISIVWSFVIFSAATIIGSIILETFIFRVASRGSPVDVNERRALPILCAIKLVPFTVVRSVTVVMALYTLTVLHDLCRETGGIGHFLSFGSGGSVLGTHAGMGDETSDCYFSPKQPFNATTNAVVVSPLDYPYDTDSVSYCPDYTVGTVTVLVCTHVLEVVAAVVLVVALTCRSVHAQQKQYLDWFFLSCCRRPQRQERRLIPKNRRESWWHSCCHWCCVVTSCCTCCLFGGSEVLRSSSTSLRSSNRSTSETTTTMIGASSVLTDISILLADYFDTGPEGSLDVTPTDLLAGLCVLRIEQHKQKQERLAHLREDDKDDDDDLELGVIVSMESVATGSFDCSVKAPDDDQDDTKNLPPDGNDNSLDNHPSVTNAPSARRYSLWDPDHVRNLQLYRTHSMSQARFKVSTRQRLQRHKEDDRRAIVEGAHYMRIAIAVYGHMMYLLQHVCTAPCCLVVGCLTCRTSSASSQSVNDYPTVVGDNRCGCNELGFLRMAGLDREDIAYVSFKSSIQLCPYGIVLDKAKQSVVVAIRGTFTLEAMVTDLNIRPESLGDYVDEYPVLQRDNLPNVSCHAGMLRCAFEIYNDLQRHQVLDRLLLGESPKFPNYSLVIVGHSMGAGIGSILSLLLSGQFQGLRCLCFSPPGCVMSEQACGQEYITSYVLESDIVPRLSFHSMIGLRNDILETVARIKVPKHVALSYDRMKARRISDLVLMHPRETIPDSTFYRRIREFHDHQKVVTQNRSACNVTLHPPGAIVHIVEHTVSGSRTSIFGTNQSMTYVPIWAERSDFAEIQVTKSMAFDHNPDKLFRILVTLAQSFR